MRARLVFFILSIFTTMLFSQTVVNYAPSDEIMLNPERGFYTAMESWNEYGSLTTSQLTSVKNKKQSLILRQYYIPKWNSGDLAGTFFTMFENDCKLMRQNGVKCVLRFAYSNNIGVADAPLSVVLRHLDQLSPYLQQYSDVIAFVQAGFIGAWGEWHSSTNGLDNTANRKAVLEKILSVLPKERMVQVRTPNYKNIIFSNYSPVSDKDAFNQSNYSRTGHHNDCFLADANDMGTYTDTSFGKNFVSFDGLYVPVGGETCGLSDFSACTNALYQMNRLHWTYLNNDYHQNVLSDWKTNNCYVEIQKKLGYRFELLNGTYSSATKQGGSLQINIALRNIGFASLYNARDVELLLRSATDTFFVKIPVDPRYWQSGDTSSINATIGIPASMKSGDYTLLLNLPDASPVLHYSAAFSIQLANTGVWEATTGYNKLNATVNVNPANSSPDYSGDLFFSKLDRTTPVENETAPVSYNMFITNYPNPFNNTTEVVYSINDPGNVKIKVFNSMGQEVGTLVNEFKDRGIYKVKFDTASLCGGLSSGIYYYVLNSFNRTISGKMILLK